MPAPGFTRGVWSRWASAVPGATLTARNALWRSDGTAVMRNGQGIPAGQTLGTATGGTSDIVALFTMFGDGGCFDSTRKQFLSMRAGGHQAWGTFEVNALDWATGSWNPSGQRPQDPYTRLVRPVGSLYVTGEFGGGTTDSPSVYYDPLGLYNALARVDASLGVRIFPNAVHSAGSALFMPSVGRVLAWGGYASHWNQTGSGEYPFEWDPATNQWEGQAADYVTGWHPFSTSTAWDSLRNRALIFNSRKLYRYDPAAAHGARMLLLYDLGSDDDADSGGLVFDPDRDRAVYFGTRVTHPGVTQYFYFDFTGNPNAPTRTDFTLVSPSGFPYSFPRPAIVRDPVTRSYVGWAGGKPTYDLTWTASTTLTVTQTTPVGGITPPDVTATTLSFGGAPGGVGHRLFYVPGDDVFATVNDVDEQGFAVFAPVRVTPVLAFTDLAQAPRSGNADTTFGQTANLDGAYVTIWGHGLGATQDTSTITIGGVAPRVIRWGPATPPAAGPANLVNGYHSMQTIIVQVDHTTPLGTQNIIITVGSVATSPLVLTVMATGTIRFAATAGAAQTALNAMVAGDITYLQNGVTVPGGLVPPSNSGTAPLAIVAAPGATVVLGSTASNGLQYVNAGSTQYLTYAKLTIYGGAPPTPGGQGVNLANYSRLIGSKIQAPLGTGSLGAVGMNPSLEASHVKVLGNEFTQCGDPANPDALYHVLYLSGIRGGAVPFLETDREVGWNYFHDNAALRAINIYNGEVQNNPITGHVVHDNVIVNQQGDGIAFLKGVVGENWVYNNLVVAAGIVQPGAGIRIIHNWGGLGWGSLPDSAFPKAGNIPHVFNNTLLNNGSGSGASGGFAFVESTGWTPDLHNNLVYQATGQPYVSSGSDTLAGATAAQASNNLWYGQGSAPAFDNSPITGDPKLSAISGTLDLHLLAGSSAIASGVNLTSGGRGLTDFDLVGRPASTPWDVGAYEFVGAGPSISALSPASVILGGPALTLVVTGSNFTSDAIVQWAGSPRATIVDSASQLRATILAGDVAAVRTVSVTVSEAAGVSPAAAFRVLYAPASLGLVYEGPIRDRVGQNEIALAPDGIMDATLAVLLNGAGGRVITALALQLTGPTGRWDTTLGNGFWVLGVASTRDGALLNNPTTGAVGFTVADGETFYIFAGDQTAPPTLFQLGGTLTLTVTLGDGSTVAQAVTIGAAGTAFTRTAADTLGLTEALTRVVLPPTSKPIVDVDLTQPPGLHATIRRVS